MVLEEGRELSELTAIDPEDCMFGSDDKVSVFKPQVFATNGAVCGATEASGGSGRHDGDCVCCAS